jgi:hypothetical protein
LQNECAIPLRIRETTVYPMNNCKFRWKRKPANEAQQIPLEAKVSE